MKLLFILVLVGIGSAIADRASNVEWTREMIDELRAKASPESKSSRLTIPELIESDGYNAEAHWVITEDNYILGMHRISGSPRSPPSRGKPVAFLMHGLLSSSADFVIMGPGKALGYELADAGYDVWMGNARGNTWSKNNTEDLRDRDFWRFSWHEIGKYDLPAMIDYTLAATSQKQLFYIGHSQGTTSFYVMGTERPEYNSKIRAMFSLAPVAYMGNLFSPIPRLMALGTNTLSTFLSLVGVHEFAPDSELVSKLAAIFCDDDALSQFLCSNVLFLMCGFNKDQLNTTMLPTLLQYVPAGAATRQLVHYGQEIRSDKFRQYDHGRIENRITYGQWSPPNYDLGAITAPVYLLYSDNDWMAAVVDVEQLYNELGNPAAMIRIPDPKWNHLDFIWGIDAHKYVYDVVIDIMKTRYPK